MGDEENISLLLCITHSDMTVSEAAFDLQTKKLFSCIQKPVGLEIYIYIAMENTDSWRAHCLVKFGALEDLFLHQIHYY